MFSRKQSGTTTIISADRVPAMASMDLWTGLLRYELWWIFAAHDIKQRFRRSTLGPIWLTLTMGIMVGALGFVFSQLFKQDMTEFLPYLAVGIIFWGLLTSTISEGCTAFIVGESYIRNVPMPISVHFYRVFARNIIIWAHNMVIYLLVIIVFPPHFSWHMLLFLPGFLLFLINLAWMGLVVGILSTRFRDIPQVVTNLLQVVFFVTPIFWSATILPDRTAFIQFNIFYHLLELVRSPLLGHIPPLQSWAIGITMALAGFPLAIWLYRRAYARIPYWV